MSQSHVTCGVFIAVFMMGCSLTIGDDAPTCTQQIEKCAGLEPDPKTVCNNVSKIDAAIACFNGVVQSDCASFLSQNETASVQKSMQELTISKAGCEPGGSGPAPGSSTCTVEKVTKCSAILPAEATGQEQPQPAASGNQTAGPATNETTPAAANPASDDAVDAMCGVMNDAKACMDEALSGCTVPQMKMEIEKVKMVLAQNMTNYKCCDFAPIKKDCKAQVSYGTPAQKPTKDACVAFYKAQSCMEEKLKSCGAGKNAFTKSMASQTTSCEKEGFKDPGSSGMTIQPALTVVMTACLAVLSALF